MLIGRRTRWACKLFGRSRVEFSGTTSSAQALVTAIASIGGPAWLTEEQEKATRRMCEQAGVEFVSEEDSESAVVRLREAWA